MRRCKQNFTKKFTPPPSPNLWQNHYRRLIPFVNFW